MGKTKIRYCEKCGNELWNMRSDAKQCRECKDKQIKAAAKKANEYKRDTRKFSKKLSKEDKERAIIEKIKSMKEDNSEIGIILKELFSSKKDYEDLTEKEKEILSDNYDMFEDYRLFFAISGISPRCLISS